MKNQPNAPRDRRDIVETTDAALSRAMLRAYHAAGALARPTPRRAAPRRAEDKRRLEMRRDLIEAPASDPTGFERVIGESDLTSINYLDRGRRTAVRLPHSCARRRR